MAVKIRSVDFLPEIFQTPVNKQFLDATLDQLIQEPKYKQTQGYIGQKVGPGVNPADNYVIEPTKVRNDYQLEPGIVSLSPTTSKIDDVITYPGILDALSTQGGITNQADRLFESEYYSWDPFVDFDKLSNYAQYYWVPNGPDLVTVAPTAIPTEQTFTVTRTNGAYTFSSYAGNNPELTLVRNGSYNFIIAQTDPVTVQYRVTNNGSSSWSINYQPNPTLTLVRGNTYVFNLIQTANYAFYIKTQESYGTTNLWTEGVTNGGAAQGQVTFTVPQDAPDTLYYCNDLQFNLRGQLNIIDASAGTGPEFWIQTEPGVNGKLPWSPNISDRDVLGVNNNGIDLGTVTFNVPDVNAQNFYYSMPYIGYPTATTGKVDLICSSFTYDQLNGVSVQQFLADNPLGIDGITNLNSRTLIFTTQSSDPDSGGWYNVTPFDPLASGDNNQTGAFDTTAFAEATPITDQSIQFSLWQIQYVNDVNGVPFIKLNSILPIADLTQFSVSFGAQYINTQWYKSAEGFFTQMPLLTAALPKLYYQDSVDPSIFGVINLIEGNTNNNVPPLSITSIISTGTSVTLTFATQQSAPYSIGSTIIVSEVNPAQYNGDYVVTACTTSTVTYSSTVTESYVNSGTINAISINAFINVDTDILGKTNYVSPNGVTFTNGLKIVFEGTVYPSSYVGNTYYVQGVGSSILLVSENELVVPETYAKEINGEPIIPDYMTINMASQDLNPWSRSNRWFHIDVIDAAAAYNDVVPDFTNVQRANRPILEFRAGTKLFNFGTQGIPAINIIDFTQTNALLNVNGQPNYGTDGYTLVEGSLVVFAADTNPDVANQIYQVNFIVVNPEVSTVPIIDLVPTSYSPMLANQTTVCLNGDTLTGQSFYYNGVSWSPPQNPWIISSSTQPANTTPVVQTYATQVLTEGLSAAQQKSTVNQPPLFDVYDINGYSFGNIEKYPSTNFGGCKLLSYAENPDNPADAVLGIPLDFFSIDNIGDILFNNNLYNDTFIYTPSGTGTIVDVSSGFVYQYSDRIAFTPEIGWQTAAIPSLPRQQFQFSYAGTPLQLDIAVETSLDVPAVQVFVNSVYQIPSSYTLSINTTTNVSTITLAGTYVIGDIIEVLAYSTQVSAQGFYEIPINLENNPFNGNSKQFSLGTIRNHYSTICENLVSLQGPINGRNNTRDLGDIIPFGQLILQQSSPLTLAGYFLRSPNYDIFAALEYNSREYIKYKNKLLTAVTQLNLNGTETVSQILDLGVRNITQSLTSSDSFYWSDMLPVGTNYTSSTTVVNPITTATFNTIQTYDFTSSNYLGLLVYVNNILLLRNSQYVVSPDAPKLTILIPLNVGDVVTINEYPTTVASWCPNTPSKMGLYPKYTPSIFVDETYSEPTVVIQGHDGSITIAFGDIRDQVLLEFEKRIYDNIKVDDNPIPLTTDEVDPDFYPAQTTALLPGFFRKTPYSYKEVNQIMSEDFLTWVGQNKVDYTQQNYSADNPFTYNYIQAANRIDGTEFLQGNWRGIYRYFYDTETPNTTPWEMVGFSEEPAWWITRYGPAPYTDGNKVLWDDMELGLVADPLGPYVLPEYVRHGLSEIIPADSEGNLLPPFESIMGKNDPYGFQQSWVAGDGGPVQASWWKSSSYPFAIMRLLALTKPAQFFSLFADRDLYRYNTALGQYLMNNRYRLDASGVQIYGNGVSKASYINWIVDYNQQTGINSTTALTEDLANLDVRLCYRMASFSDPVYVQLFTERAGPSSSNNSLLIPPTSYDLLFYKNQPFNQITYSSVIVQVEQVAGGGIGYSVFGYSNVQPYFEILISSPVGLYQTISAGDTTVQVPSQYTANVKQIPYGYVFTSPASVCDFLLGYGAWLTSQGLVFDDTYNGYTLDWKQMAQEFLYFGAQGWQPGTMINLNPCATTIKASQPISIVDTIASVTPENMLLDQNRFVLDVRTMVVNRNGNEFSVTTTTGQTINYLTLKFTNYEDMIVLNNTSQYNDLIYDPITAARQVRLSLIASTTTEWDGQLNAQGFILNLNNVKEWQQYHKYTKGEIVLYKNTYWQAIDISEPQETFNYADWVKSDYQAIDNGLLPNLANKADQLVDTYNVYTANLTSDNDLFAFGLIGFRPRPYMSDMNLNGVTQVQIYQQFLGSKGTLRAAEIFNASQLNGKESGDYNVYENWGILSGTYGAQANKSYFEIQLNQALLPYNPSTIQIINPGQISQANQAVYLNNLWRESYNITSPDILPTTYENSSLSSALPSAGYVCLDDVDVTVFSLEDPSAISADIDNIGIGTYIWIAKINSYDWGVYRVASVPGQMTQLTDNLDGTSIVQFNAAHNLSVSDLIIIKYFNVGANGVYRVLGVPTPTTLTIAFSFTNTNVTTVSGNGLVFHLQSARVSQASNIASLPYVNSLVPGAIAWVDNDGNGHWETVQKQTPFTTSATIAPGLVAANQYGASIAQTQNNFAALVGAPTGDSGAGSVLTYFKSVINDYQFGTTLSLGVPEASNFGNMLSFGNSNWAIAGANTSMSGTGYAALIYRDADLNSMAIAQILVPPDLNFGTIGFGTSGAISLDEKWLYVGAPGANTVYAYEKIEVEIQTVEYTTANNALIYEYSNEIQVNSQYSGQLIVTLSGFKLTPGIDYTINQNNLIFTAPPTNGQKLVMTRNLETQLDDYYYYGVQQNSTSGTGVGAVFTVENTRGEYYVTLADGGSSYRVNDVLTINGTQIGGTTPANNLVITVTAKNTLGQITGFSYTGAGISNANNFALNQYLYNATSISSFIVKVNGVIQRPYLDYTFNNSTTVLTFVTIPGAGAKINVITPTYWQYVTNITSSSSISGDSFGASVTTTTDGRQIMIGAPNADVNGVINAGTVYVFDRSVIRYIVSNPSQMTYTVPGSVTGPVAVSVNKTFLLTTAQAVLGQYTVNGNNIVFSNIIFNYGDIIEIETNQMVQIQELVSNTVDIEANYGLALDACPLNCSLYIGAPFDSTYLLDAGSVDHQVNQSRVYGVTTSTIANPILFGTGTLRINDTVVTVPAAPNNTVVGFAAAINAARIPNVVAQITPNLEFITDGVTKVFNIGTLYTDASSYTTIVYLDNILQTVGGDYSYDPTTQNIYFVYAPTPGRVITVVSGRLTISVENINAGTASNLITVLPGPVNSVFTELGFDTFVFTQQILSPLPVTNGQFGASLSIDSSAVNLIVGSPNGNIYEPTTFDAGQTYFDEHSTTFYNPVNNGGVAYTYDYFLSSNNNINDPGQFAFGQQIYNSITQTGDHFGASVNYTTGKLMVGATGGTIENTASAGYVTIFDNLNDTPAWAPIRTQQPVVDVYAIAGVFSYNGGQAIGVNVTATGETQTYFDFFDPLQGKILGVARRNIDYIGAVDPAQYNQGTVHNNGQQWGKEHLGQMWWDTDTVRFIDPNQDDIVYASRRWGTTFPGSSVDIYQWVESTNPPSSYSGQGTPLSVTSYCVASQLGTNNIFTTLYYFWVKGITTIASGAGKTLSSSGVSNYITDPRSSGLPYIAGLNASTIAIYNAQSLLNSTNTILSVGFDRQLNDAVIHQEYQIIKDGIAKSFLNPQLYRKLLDSFCGVDTAGNAVPDPSLSLGMQFGVQFRPRQSMFADRFTALENYLGRANTVLAQFPITETRSFNLLNASEPIPEANSGAWNFEVANLEILGYQNLNIVPVGYKYLVLSDSSQEGLWTIYEVQADKTLSLLQVQSYNTPKYWYYINWYLPGYNSTVAPVAAVQNYGQLSTLTYNQAPVGSSVRVLSNGSGKWEIYLRTGLNAATDWQRVGLEDGTIAFAEDLWNYSVGNFGFDAQVFDSQYFDETPQTETRYIIRALNEEIYIDELQIERNSSLVLVFNYVYSEFTDPSWLIKTSYVDVNHKIRSLLPYQTYLADNQDFVLNYFQEVKPYHVQVRQFNLIYTGEDDFLGDITDYDLPAYWKSTLEVPQFVSPILTPYTEAVTTNYSTVSDTPPNAQIWQSPSLYSQWFENYCLTVEKAIVVKSGAGYTSAPVVTVSGTCVTPATMTAIINSTGQVIGVTVVTPGSGYTTDATITISGGGLPGNPTTWETNLAVNSNAYIITSWNNIYQVVTGGNLGNIEPIGTGTVINGDVTLVFVGQIAQAVSIMGNSLVRSFNVTLKYDRYEYQSTIIDWEANTTYENGTQVRYENKVWSANGTSGSVTNSVFDPTQWTKVDANLLSGVNRTMGYYVSTVNTPGLSLPLLIDGIDYPGVQVAALTFEQDTGYDRGSFDINPFDNISIDASGQPTYDLNILDTIFESSYLDPYLGTRPTSINVDGGKYVDAFESHAPEELVPGIEFDTLDMRVYTTPGADWQGLGHGFPQAVAQIIYNSSRPTTSFAGLFPYPCDIEITDATQGYDLSEGVDYTVDWPNQTFTINSSSRLVINGDQLGIYVYELGGGNQVYKNVYNGADVGNTIIVPVSYYQADGTTPAIQEFVIFVNGNYLNSTHYTYAYNSFSTTRLTFTTTYTSTDFISLVVIEPTTINGVTTDYSWSLPVSQEITVTATGQLVYALNPAFSLSYTNSVNAIVTIGGITAIGSSGVPYVGDGTTTTFEFPQRLNVDPTTIPSSNVLVYLSGTYILPFNYSITTSSGNAYVQFNTAPADGVEIYIAVNISAQYIIDPIAQTLTFVSGAGIIPRVGQLISVTTFNDTREQRLSTQIFYGPVSEGIAVYEAFDSTDYDNPPGDPSADFGEYDATVGAVTYSNDLVLYQSYEDIARPWVSINGKTLTAYLDYTIDGNVLNLNNRILQTNDVVVVTNVTSSVVPEAMEFRIFQDMRGVQATYRMTPATTTTVTQTVTSTDDIIHIADAGALTIPNFAANIWGVVTINGERIMYRNIDLSANTISSLLRGTAGTAAAPHIAGALVYDMGRGNLMPEEFQNYVQSNYFLGDGTTNVFVTDINLNNANDWTGSIPYDSTLYSTTGPDGEYDPGMGSNIEAVEVYLGGELQTSGYGVTNTDTVTVAFDIPPADGEGVIILVRRGVTWYAPGASTPSNGVPLQETNTPAALFLRGVN